VTVESGDQNAEQEAGAQSASVSTQLPENQGAGGSALGPNRKSTSSQNSEDTTYDNSSTHTITMRVPGQIKRLTIAVMVDGGPKGLPAAQIQRLQRIVENAAGVDTQRGDSVVVESMPFAKIDPIADADGGLLSLVPMDRIFQLIELLVIAGVGIVAIRMLRPKSEPAADAQALIAEGETAPALAAPAGDPAPTEGDTAESLAQLDNEVTLAQVDGGIKQSVLRRIGNTIAESPPEATSVIRHWMNG